MNSKLAAHAEIKPIFVRLTEAERRRIKTLAASQGLTMREAIILAFEVWASQLRSGRATATPKRGASEGTETAARGSAGGRSDPRHQSGYASDDQQIGVRRIGGLLT
jgi:hypothetical protein